MKDALGSQSTESFCINIKSQCGSHTKGSRRMYSVIVTHIRCGETTGTGRPSGSKTNRAPPSAARAIALLCREAHCLYQSAYNLQLYFVWTLLNLTIIFMFHYSRNWMSYQLSFNKNIFYLSQHISMTNEFLRCNDLEIFKSSVIISFTEG